MGSCFSDALAWALAPGGAPSVEKHGPFPASPLIPVILQLSSHLFCEYITKAVPKGCQIKQIKIQDAWLNLNFRKIIIFYCKYIPGNILDN